MLKMRNSTMVVIWWFNEHADTAVDKYMKEKLTSIRNKKSNDWKKTPFMHLKQ